MTQRRDFLKQAGLLSAAALAAPGLLLAAPPKVLPKIGLQLYTLRDYIGKDVQGVLAKVSQAGYQEVETYGYTPEGHFWGLTPPEFKKALAAHGLTTSSGHYDLGSYLRDGNQDTLKASISAAKACGQACLIVPYLDEKLRTSLAECNALAIKLNQAGHLCRTAGLKLGYHNHNFEFKPLGGTTLYEVLLQQTDPKLVAFEMDVYWVVRAGLDPLKLLAAHPGRFPLWHVKDMDKARPELNTEVGAGSIDFVALFKRGRAAGLQHLFMEQENFTLDAFQSIGQSAAFIKKNLLPALAKA